MTYKELKEKLSCLSEEQLIQVVQFQDKTSEYHTLKIVYEPMNMNLIFFQQEQEAE